MQRRFELLRGVVHPWHHDHFGHMNVRHYAPFFDDAVYHLWTALGLPYVAMAHDHGLHTVTAEAKTRFLRELTAGDLIVIDGAVARVGTKSCAFHLRMLHADTGALHATCDVVEVFFDPGTRAAAAMPEAVRATLAAHASPTEAQP
jgi:acyl-CoA thioester hydrolase